MKVQWRTNPKTPDGWPKRIAIAVLTALGAFMLSAPLTFLLFLGHNQHATPKDPQNVLNALTSAVLIGLVLGAFTIAAVVAVFLLFGMRTKAARPITP